VRDRHVAGRRDAAAPALTSRARAFLVLARGLNRLVLKLGVRSCGLGFGESRRPIGNRPQAVRINQFGQDNSFATGHPKDELRFGKGGVDDAEDAEVILHEYGHAIHFAQNFSFASEQAGAISEGFGDYWAVTVADVVSTSLGVTEREPLPCVADWDSASYTSTVPHCLRRVDTRSAEAYLAGRRLSPAISRVSNGQVRGTPASTWSRNVVGRSEFSHFAEIAADCVLSCLPHRGVPATRARGGRSHGRGQAGQLGRAASRVPTARQPILRRHPGAASESRSVPAPRWERRCGSTGRPARCGRASPVSMRVALPARARPAEHTPSRGCGCPLVCGPAHEHARCSVSVPGAGSGVAEK
jgi:hypothetical protein